MSVEKATELNSEILFLYEARLCNPNGDPDRENKPRLDFVTQRNYVTDVRLKRFIRDYIIAKKGEKYIWVTTLDGKNVTPDVRIEASRRTWGYKRLDEVPKKHFDVRLFGATLPMKGEKKPQGKGKGTSHKGKGTSHQIVGPVQFAMGYSLHKVKILSETSTITSRFVGAEKEAERQYGTIGKDWRVYYSLIAFYGVVNAARGKFTNLREVDVKLLDNIMWESVIRQSITRSKIGHFPHLYLRIEYKDGETLLGDLRRHIHEDFNTENVRNLEDLSISFDPLVEKIQQNSNRVKQIYIRTSDEFENKFRLRESIAGLGVTVSNLPHPGIGLDDKILVIDRI